MLVDIGGGTLPHPQADYVIDLHHPRRSPMQDATQTPWQIDGGGGFAGRPAAFLPDGQVDTIWASHVLEHIPKGEPLIRLMNECHRVLRPGGRMLITMPIVGYTDPATGAPMSNQIGWQPWADPTHVSFWWAPESLLYLCEGAFKANADYGVATWAPLGGFTDDPHTHPAGGWTVRGEWELSACLIRP